VCTKIEDIFSNITLRKLPTPAHYLKSLQLEVYPLALVKGLNLWIKLCCLHVKGCRLGGVMVSVLAIGPKAHKFKPGQCNGFLRVIKIRSTSSFRGGVKPEAHVVTFYGM
jgi:hypothetical protein